MVSQQGGLVRSSQGIETQTAYSFETAPQFDILMVPGGMGTRSEINNAAMLAFIQKQDKATQWTVSVCTGAALLAKAGVLKQRRATSNKLAFDFAVAQDGDVLWQKQARWVFDGKYVTSSGVSAGTDMALALVAKLYNREQAESIAHWTEYVWNSDPTIDPFAR
jgi:putative intracellular protease/amidase